MFGASHGAFRVRSAAQHRVDVFDESNSSDQRKDIMTNNIPPIGEAATPQPVRPRRHLRLAAIGGIAAIAILGGGITAVASASAPTSSTSTVAPPTSGVTAPTSGSAAPGMGTRPARPTPKPHLDGAVTSVSGSTVLIKDRDGFTRTIVVSSKTTYADGLKAALTSGTEIYAEGTVAANGTSLNATSIGKRPTPPAGGPDGGGPGGPGGPWGRGGRGGPPAGGPGNGPGPGGKPAPPTGTAAPSTSSAAPTTS